MLMLIFLNLSLFTRYIKMKVKCIIQKYPMLPQFEMIVSNFKFLGNKEISAYYSEKFQWSQLNGKTD